MIGIVTEYIVLWLLYGQQDGWKMMDLSQTVYIGYYERQQALYAQRSERPQVWRHTINKHDLPFTADLRREIIQNIEKDI